MVYVMSDIHGDYEKYRNMLKLIELKDTDTLYILGDVIDRGEHGMKILKDMMLRPNVIPIIGNHEYMALSCMKFLMQEVTEESIQTLSIEMLQGINEWMNVGGESSIKEFRSLSMEEREDIVEYLSEFELYEIVEAGGRTYVLVHAGLCGFRPDRELDNYDISEMIFQSPEYDQVYYDDKYLVTGHLPTRVIHAREQGVLLEELSTEQIKDEIYEKNHHIAIDCGSSYGGKLGCICLDDLRKFYV